MPRVIVDVMLKPEILDPQGRAVIGAFTRLGVDDVTDIRQGKRFEISVQGALTEDTLENLHRMAAELLSNPVIEDYQLRIEE